MSDSPLPPGSDFPGLDGPPLLAGYERLHRLADAVRRINEAVVGHPVPDDTIDDATDRLEEIADMLAASAEPSRRPYSQSGPIRHPQDSFPTSPLTGYANPVAPVVELWAAEGQDGYREMRARVTYGYSFEGPPDCVHGGVLAGLFDEVMGVANIMAGKPVMTGTLTVRYLRPTPLLAPLDVVGRFTGTAGRKVFSWGGVYCAGVLTAEAEGIFIEVPPDLLLPKTVTGETSEPLIDPQLGGLIADTAAD